MPKAAEQSVPRCPRCGYDQSGACAAWAGACPIEGTCPECGLTFNWGDVFAPWRNRLEWLYDHKAPRSFGVTRAWSTWARAMLPGHFWSRVTPRVRTSRAIWLWSPTLFVSLLVAVGVARATAACFSKYPWFDYVAFGSFAGRPPRADGPGLFARIGEFFWLYWCYPLWPAPQGTWPPKAFLQALTEVWAVPVATLAASAACVGTMVSLRGSRRIGAVRNAHLVRAGVYRLAPLAAVYVFWMSCLVAQDFWWPSRLGAWHSFAWGAVFVMLMAWGWYWWWSAVTRGWLMPRSRIVAAMIGTIDVLTFVIVFLWLSPEFMRGFVE